MTKPVNIDETGDSAELQALFDSLSSVPAAPAPVVEAPKPVDTSGDNDELQSLFDSVADEYTPPVAVDGGPSEETGADGKNEVVFNRIGQMTRKLHDTLRELGYDRKLEDTAKAIPDARQRLAYIAQMTEQAASKVLNATDIAQPLQDALQQGAGDLQGRWNQLFAGQLTGEGFKALVHDTRAFLGTVEANTQATNAQLMEIMMAQDFQDLTGQVIKKVVEMAQRLETELLQVLIESMPDDLKVETGGLLNGPVISAAGREDVVTNQEQVDDLLESLGF